MILTIDDWMCKEKIYKIAKANFIESLKMQADEKILSTKNS